MAVSKPQTQTPLQPVPVMNEPQNLSGRFGERKMCASVGIRFPSRPVPKIFRLLSRVKTLSSAELGCPLFEKHWSGRRIVVAEIGQIRIECLL